MLEARTKTVLPESASCTLAKVKVALVALSASTPLVNHWNFGFGMPPARIDGAVKPLTTPGTHAEKFAFGLGEKEARLRQTLDLFVSAMLRGAFPAFPNNDDDDFNSCKYCPVNHSCRTKHDDVERYAVVRQKDPRTLLEKLS